MSFISDTPFAASAATTSAAPARKSVAKSGAGYNSGTPSTTAILPST